MFRIHSFHLQRDTTYFDDSIASLSGNPGQGSVGSIDANPLPVDDVNAIDFEHLLWFFYESAYNWCVHCAMLTIRVCSRPCKVHHSRSCPRAQVGVHSEAGGQVWHEAVG